MAFIFQFVNVVYYIDLQILKNPCIPGIKPTWSWCIIISFQHFDNDMHRYFSCLVFAEFLRSIVYFFHKFWKISAIISSNISSLSSASETSAAYILDCFTSSDQSQALCLGLVILFSAFLFLFILQLVQLLLICLSIY